MEKIIKMTDLTIKERAEKLGFIIGQQAFCMVSEIQGIIKGGFYIDSSERLCCKTDSLPSGHLILTKGNVLSADELIAKIEQWGTDRGFYDKEHGTNSEKQFLKLSEEIGEIAGNLARGKDVRDDIGDAFVVLTGLAKLNGLSITECIQVAWDDIKDRRGAMRNGVFIKESDL